MNLVLIFLYVNYQFQGGSTEEEKIRVDIAENQVCLKIKFCFCFSLFRMFCRKVSKVKHFSENVKASLKLAALVQFHIFCDVNSFCG